MYAEYAKYFQLIKYTTGATANTCHDRLNIKYFYLKWWVSKDSLEIQFFLIEQQFTWQQIVYSPVS